MHPQSHNNQSPPFTFEIQTFGCKANLFDSLVLQGQLESLGGVRRTSSAPSQNQSPSHPHVLVVNSCTVTAEADRQSMKAAELAKRAQSNTITVMTGCMAQVASAKLSQTSFIDIVANNQEKNHIRQLITERLGLPPIPEEQQWDVAEEFYWGQLPTYQDRTRAFLKIQEGCNDRCTYCIIPDARGPSRSMNIQRLLDEIRRLTFQGVREVILTGTNIADYGLDFESSLDDLVAQILRETSLPRLRLSSLDPSEVSDRLLQIMVDSPRLMPHFHLSVQSASSRVLRAMKRNYRADQVESTLTSIGKLIPRAFVGMDIISGFPSETEEEHLETMALLQRTPWTRLHVFPYSERQGTPATKIQGSLPMAERKRRAKELMVLSSLRHETFVRSFLGKTVHNVLMESPLTLDSSQATGTETPGVYVLGHSPEYLRLAVEAPDVANAESLRNQIISVDVHDIVAKPTQDFTLIGRVHGC